MSNGIYFCCMCVRGFTPLPLCRGYNQSIPSPTYRVVATMWDEYQEGHFKQNDHFLYCLFLSYTDFKSILFETTSYSKDVIIIF